MSELMSTRLLQRYEYFENDLIGLSTKCDWFLSCEFLVKKANTETPRTIYVSTEHGYRTIPYFVRKVLPLIKNNVILILASTDCTFPYDIGEVRDKYFARCQSEIRTMLENIYIEKLYVENLDFSHPKCFPIPLGILRQNIMYDQYKRIQEANIDCSAERQINVLCCHRHRNGKQWEKRKIVTNFAKKEWSSMTTVYEEVEKEETFFKLLLNSKFCLCVQGGGYDPSPKCWQALLCGSIPIVEYSPVSRAYERFPIVFVDKWQENTLTEDFLKQAYLKLSPFFLNKSTRANMLQMLSLDYWYDSIFNNDCQIFDPICILSPLVTIAKQKNVIFLYGTDTLRVDVTIIAFQCFATNAQSIVIKPSANFNECFGDVYPGMLKTLKIQFKNEKSILLLGEQRAAEFSIKI